MSNQRILELNEKLKILNTSKDIEDALNVAITIASWFGTYTKKSVFPSDQRKEATKNWFFNAIGRSDLPATYALELENQIPIDFKLFWVKKSSKQIISGVTRFTSNFEDETFFKDLNIGIDFIVPPETDRVIIALSKGYIIRTLEIGNKITVTQEEILHKWLQEFDYSNKAYVHGILWESFSLKPLNDKFYDGISQFFQELVQHNESKKVLFADATHFTNRLIGRILFCWFLRKKNIIAEDEFEYFDTRKYETSDKYYLEKLRGLFFDVLNTPLNLRKHDKKTPYLNGGLFEEKRIDKINEISFPDSYFQRLYAFLGEYNFTTDESTSSFQQIAVDPEMLGKIFEKLLAKEVRKEKGAFYTPREIVDYMCKQSLKLHLETKLTEQGISESDISKINEALFEKTDSDIALYEKNAQYDIIQSEKLGKRNEIIKSLQDLKVLDPACGSGAFPMGMLQLIISCYERIKAPEAKDLAELKKNVIANNLYGVDIEPMAVEITRLRAWLSIIVDEMDSSKIEPLPNLDFKFVCANSLIPLKEESNLFDNENLAIKLQMIRTKYFKASAKEEKEKIKSEFNYLTKNGQFGAFSSEREKQLQSYKPFDSDNICDFFDPKFMFGVNEGFDVVIGNPPYVQLQKLVGSEVYSKIGLNTYSRSSDLYCLFYEKGVLLLKNGGKLCYITSNSWLQTKYGERLRNYFELNTNPVQLINFANCQIFDTAIVESNILILIKESFKGKLKACNLGGDEIFLDSIEKNCNSQNIIIEKLDSKGWNIGDSDIINLKQKIEIQSLPLSKQNIVILSGIKTGLNKAFIIGEKIKDQLIKADNRNSEIIRPILRGKDIQKYYFHLANYWVIYTHNGSKVKKIKPVNVERDYPVIYEYLKSFKSELENRPSKGDTWGNLPANYTNLFESPKLIWGELSDIAKFAYDSTGTYIEATAFLLTGDNIKYLLAILNSTLGQWYFERITTTSGMGTNRWKKYKIQQFPIKIATVDRKKEFEIKVDEILAITQREDYIQNDAKKIQVKELEKEIDKMVYKLYDLTDEEIKVVENR